MNVGIRKMHSSKSRCTMTQTNEIHEAKHRDMWCLGLCISHKNLQKLLS